MYIFSVSLYLTLRKLQKLEVSSDVNNAVMFVIGTVVLLAYGVITRIDFSVDYLLIAIILVTTFLFSYLGSKASLESIRLAANPGYSLIIQKSYAIYTALVAMFLFGSTLTLKNTIAILIVTGFVALLVDLKNTKKNKENTKWIVLAFLAFFAFGNLALTSKWLLNEGVEPYVRTFYVQLFVASMFLFDILFQKTRGKTKAFKQLLDKKYFIWFIIIGLSQVLFNLFAQYAYDLAPNIGYVNIINTASIAAITLLSAFIFQDKLETRKLIGIIGVTAGIILLLL